MEEKLLPGDETGRSDDHLPESDIVVVVRNPSSIGRDFLKIAVPTTVIFSVTSCSNFLGAYILSLTGKDGIAASGLFSSLQMLLQSFTYSFLFVVGPLAGRINDDSPEESKENSEAREKGTTLFVFGNSMALLLAVPMTLFYAFSKQFFIATGQDPKISEIAADAFTPYTWGCWADVALIATSQYAIAKKESLATLGISLTQKALTLGLAYQLVFGVNGFPKMGPKGLGLAYSIFSTTSVAGFTVYLAARNRLHRINLTHLRQHFSQFKDILRYGWPISLHMGSELAVLSWLIQMAGQIDANNLTATEVVCQYAGFSIAVIVGLSQGAGMLVSMFVDDPATIRKIMRLAMLSSAGLTALTGAFFVSIPRQMTDVFLHNSMNGTNSPVATIDDDEVYDVSSWLFLILALTNVPDNLRNIHTGALRGLLDTHVPMIANVTQSVTNLLLAYLLMYTTELGAPGLFIARGVSIAALSIFLGVRWSRLRPVDTEIENDSTASLEQNGLFRPLLEGEKEKDYEQENQVAKD